ncbi:MAG: M1 family aminopeptidase [Bacteroidales bacterium]
MKTKYLILILLLPLYISCSNDNTIKDYGTGVSLELAKTRKAEISGLKYKLFFDIPAKTSQAINAGEIVTFEVKEPTQIVLDFKDTSTSLKKVLVNNKPIKIIYDFCEDRQDNVVFANEHINIPLDLIVKGKNKITIFFSAGNLSLNRKDDFLYTLFVPDRARTAFPCFDQPDLKATYSLSLVVPNSWKAISNTTIKSQGHKITNNLLNIKISNDKTAYNFADTKPLSTYLFSFVAGNFKKVTETHNGMSISLYHRETDKARIAQIPDIFNQVFTSINWLEDYTKIKYPFAKYDFIILPGFQFGGMEHTGATLYNDNRMFLSKNPTTSEKLSRMQLIAHETTHMWFGDLVTMKWFNNVWTKEVFANYLASKQTIIEFPDVNLKLNNLKDYFVASYAQDRTEGSTSIKQHLDNLNNAGLIYNNIIYEKTPIVMGMLEEMIGEQKFQEGLQEYLKKYSYSNASWNDLIKILDAKTDKNLASWSNSWVNKKGRPEFSYSINIKKNKDPQKSKYYITVNQKDPLNRGVIWPENIDFKLIYKTAESKADANIKVFSDKAMVTKEIRIEKSSNNNAKKIAYVIPNPSGESYGLFKMDNNSLKYCLDNLSYFKDDDTRMSVVINLYENMLKKNISSEELATALIKYLPTEQNSLIFSTALSDLANTTTHYAKHKRADAESMLYKYAKDTLNNSELRLLSFRTLYTIVTDKDIINVIYKLWNTKNSFKGLTLDIKDYTNMAYQLMIRYPKKYYEIRDKQLKKITNPDRRKSYEFVVRALSSDQDERDIFMNTLLLVENRNIEPDVTKSLSYLNHFLRQEESKKYIYPALEELKDIKATGGIFFPSSWCRALLSGHDSEEAFDMVQAFLDDNPDYPILLKNKILAYMK